jgi:hypothetical protein
VVPNHFVAVLFRPRWRGSGPSRGRLGGGPPGVRQDSTKNISGQARIPVFGLGRLGTVHSAGVRGEVLWRSMWVRPAVSCLPGDRVGAREDLWRSIGLPGPARQRRVGLDVWVVGCRRLWPVHNRGVSDPGLAPQPVHLEARTGWFWWEIALEVEGSGGRWSRGGFELKYLWSPTDERIGRTWGAGACSNSDLRRDAAAGKN